MSRNIIDTKVHKKNWLQIKSCKNESIFSSEISFSSKNAVKHDHIFERERCYPGIASPLWLVMKSATIFKDLNMNSVFTKKLHFPQNAVRRAVKHDILHIGCKSILLGIYAPSMVQKQWILTQSQALIKSLQKSLIYPQNVGRHAVKHDIPYGM